MIYLQSTLLSFYSTPQDCNCSLAFDRDIQVYVRCNTRAAPRSLPRWRLEFSGTVCTIINDTAHAAALPLYLMCNDAVWEYIVSFSREGDAKVVRTVSGYSLIIFSLMHRIQFWHYCTVSKFFYVTHKTIVFAVLEEDNQMTFADIVMSEKCLIHIKSSFEISNCQWAGLDPEFQFLGHVPLCPPAP